MHYFNEFTELAVKVSKFLQNNYYLVGLFLSLLVLFQDERHDRLDNQSNVGPLDLIFEPDIYRFFWILGLPLVNYTSSPHTQVAR